jgi:hypothetical protein
MAHAHAANLDARVAVNIRPDRPPNHVGSAPLSASKVEGRHWIRTRRKTPPLRAERPGADSKESRGGSCRAMDGLTVDRGAPPADPAKSLGAPRLPPHSAFAGGIVLLTDQPGRDALEAIPEPRERARRRISVNHCPEFRAPSNVSDGASKSWHTSAKVVPRAFQISWVAEDQAPARATKTRSTARSRHRSCPRYVAGLLAIGQSYEALALS